MNFEKLLSENMLRFGTKNLTEQQSGIDKSKITTETAQTLVDLVVDAVDVIEKLEVTPPGSKVPVTLKDSVTLRVAENRWILFNSDGVRSIYLDPNDPNIVTARSTAIKMPTDPVALWSLISKLADPHIISDNKLLTLAKAIQQRNWVNLKNINVASLERQSVASIQKDPSLRGPFEKTMRGFVFALANGAGNAFVTRDIKTIKDANGNLRFK